MLAPVLYVMHACCCASPHSVGIHVVQPVGVSGALVDQVKLVLVRHADHVVVLPRGPVHQRHDHRRVAQTDLL